MTIGYSRLLIAMTPTVPMPWMPKTDSVSTAPLIAPPMENPRMVTMGTIAFLHACTTTTLNSESPLALAVLT